jgi:hypothetical protein
LLELMREHCNRISQLYREMRRRLGAPLAFGEIGSFSLRS